MQPFILQLMNEHRFIEQVLVAFRAHVECDEPQPAATAAFAEFFRGYADDIHHAKEEAILFREMERDGFSRAGGPLSVMYYEHGLGRDAVTALSGMARGLSRYSRLELEGLRGIAGDFTQLLLGHISKEDRVLYPLVLSKLPAETLARVELETRARDAAAAKAGALARFEKLGRDLITTNAPKCGGAADWVCSAYCHG